MLRITVLVLKAITSPIVNVFIVVQNINAIKGKTKKPNSFSWLKEAIAEKTVQITKLISSEYLNDVSNSEFPFSMLF